MGADASADVAAWVQAIAAVISLGSVIWLGLNQNAIVKHQSDVEDKRAQQLRRTVAKIVSDRIDLFAVCAEKVSGENDTGMLKTVDITLELPNELVASVLDTHHVQELFRLVGWLRAVKDLVSREDYVHTEEVSRHAAAISAEFLTLKQELERIP